MPSTVGTTSMPFDTDVGTGKTTRPRLCPSEFIEKIVLALAAFYRIILRPEHAAKPRPRKAPRS